jgi:hypothetical protein
VLGGWGAGRRGRQAPERGGCERPDDKHARERDAAHWMAGETTHAVVQEVAVAV